MAVMLTMMGMEAVSPMMAGQLNLAADLPVSDPLHAVP
jgi:hypothetical protein